MKTLILILVALPALLFSQVALTSSTKTVTTAGTPVRLTANDTLTKWVTVQALSTNTGTVCVGGSTVLASSRNGTCLTAGQAAPFYYMLSFPYNLSSFWVDATVNGEGVSFTYAQ